MTAGLWNIAGIASELSVTPQAASAWHRGPEATPAPSFKVEGTGLELWTVDDIELWHQWVENRTTAKKVEKENLEAATKAKKASKAMAATRQRVAARMQGERSEGRGDWS